MEKTIHHGRNIKRFREMLGYKQEAFAFELGDDWKQKNISELEHTEVIDDDLLLQIAKVLKVPVEAIKNFDEEAAINIISNTFHDTNGLVNYSPIFNVNPVDKWMEALEENKRLYTQLLKEKDEKIILMQKLVDKRK